MHRAPAALSAVAREQPEATANSGESSHGESGGGESGGGAQGLAMLSALCAPLPKLPLVAEMPRRMVPSGDAKTSMRARA